MFVAFAQGAALALPAVLQPGPLQAFLLARSTRWGWRRTLPAAFAPLLTDGPILVLVLVLLTQVPPWGLRALQVGGGVFLLVLARGALAGARAAHAGTVAIADPNAARRSLRDAVVLNLLSPMPYAFWSLVAGPLLLEAWARSAWAAAAFLLGFYGLFVGGLCATILLFAALRRAGTRFTFVAGLVSAVALAGFGGWQIARGLGL